MDGPGTKPGTLQLQSGTSPTTDLPRPISMVHIAPPPPPPHYSITYIYALLTYCTNYPKSDKLIKFKSETILLQYFSNAQIYNERVRRVLNFKKIKTYDISYQKNSHWTLSSTLTNITTYSVHSGKHQQTLFLYPTLFSGSAHKFRCTIGTFSFNQFVQINIHYNPGKFDLSELMPV